METIKATIIDVLLHKLGLDTGRYAWTASTGFKVLTLKASDGKFYCIHNRAGWRFEGKKLRKDCEALVKALILLVQLDENN